LFLLENGMQYIMESRLKNIINKKLTQN